MASKEIAEYRKENCRCDKVFVKKFEMKKFGNGAHIIIPKDFLKEYTPTVIIGLWKKTGGN
ncbi:hypothetical protein COU37_02970 [Candidatus Micrarchaeota archaeon CG10_big_fil_rev_8_21_14_0_10_45_29]|nr:MAG: hypothetical protein COU37_02970 [Candidatus Micrarchaeota archaeon CG10_big_fil_rev_8_21_14_0_10_45_29]